MSEEKITTKSELLRKLAEERLESERVDSIKLHDFYESDILKFVYELEVYKIELEMKFDETERMTSL